jgi:hypothetical protein
VHEHHAAVAVALRTSRRSHACCNRPSHPVRRLPPQLRIAALAPHAPLIRCRISPRRRTARCPWSWRARRRAAARYRTAHERIAPPLGNQKNSPAFARSSSARAPDTTQRTARPCAAGRLRVYMKHAAMQHATRADAARTEETCNMQCASMQHARRTDATRIDATC